MGQKPLGAKRDMKNNLGEIKTTVICVAIWVITGFYFALPYFHEKDVWQPETYAVLMGFIGGLLLLLAPNRFVDFLFKWLDKKK